MLDPGGDPSPDRGEPSSPVQPAESLDQAVAIIFDLETRDGRKAVEVREVAPLANGWSASARATIYSCAYSSQKERILALQRARTFCDVRGRKVVHFVRSEDKRAAWQ